jgi:hypothetical protein
LIKKGEKIAVDKKYVLFVERFTFMKDFYAPAEASSPPEKHPALLNIKIPPFFLFLAAFASRLQRDVVYLF